MKRRTKTLRCSMQLADLELKIEIYDDFGCVSYKVFHEENEVLSEFDFNNITFDLNGTITLLHQLAFSEKVKPHDRLSRLLTDYEAERGKGAMTEYFKKGFKIHTSPGRILTTKPAQAEKPRIKNK